MPNFFILIFANISDHQQTLSTINPSCSFLGWESKGCPPGYNTIFKAIYFMFMSAIKRKPFFSTISFNTLGDVIVRTKVYFKAKYLHLVLLPEN